MALIKEVDRQGRLVLPKKWRVKNKGLNKVIISFEGERLIIEPYRPVDVTKYFDSIEADVKADLGDWRHVKRDLHEVR
ncbi:MAG: AbrB/MazE/SpoVT family DNA-binding domain-containing protein [Candidatus Verstraetearchaeota archaeon]|nr:AbrB/MazE/SpoVT family DNA-binding domain-containing protein [Candidatus Verstraetearchaeota archaeon]